MEMDLESVGMHLNSVIPRPFSRKVSPAWNNQNLRNVARVTKSTCIFAHVRAATIGGELSQTNCHPFSWKNYLFMHNGTIFGFEKIRRTLRKGLSDEAYDMIRGYTDTEHIFALFTDQVKEFSNPTIEDLSHSLMAAISRIESLKIQANVATPSTMNIVLSDGYRMLATRYVSAGEDSNSLYISRFGQFYCEDGLCHLEEGKKLFLLYPNL